MDQFKIAQDSFQQFIQGNYKEAHEQLNSKQLKFQDDNILLCEYLTNPSESNKTLYLKNLDSLMKDLKEKQIQKDVQNSYNVKQKSNNNINSSVSSERNGFADNTITKYNYAILMYFHGLEKTATNILEELTQSCKQDSLYIQQKIGLFFLELSIKRNNEQQIQCALNYLASLNQVKQNKNSNHINNQNSNQNDKNSFVNNSSNGNKNGIYSSVAFGSEININSQSQNMSDTQQNQLSQQLEFYFIQNILKTQLYINYNDYKQAKKNLKLSNKTLLKLFQFLQQNQNHNNQNQKHDINKSQHKINIIPFVQKQCLTIFKYTKAYLAFKEKNYQKAIKQLCPNSTIATDFNLSSSEFYDYQQNFQIFHLNNLGCIHIKQKKYGLANYYIEKAIHICQKQIKNNNQILTYEDQFYQQFKGRFKTLIKNMGLSLLFQKKYEQAYNFLSKISSETCDDYKLWYRIGCGLIEIYHKNLQQNYQKKENGLFKEIIDQYGLKYSLYNAEKEKQRKDSDMNNIDSAQQYNQLQRQQQQIKIQNQKMIFKQHYRRFLLDKKESQNNRSQNNQSSQQQNQENKCDRINLKNNIQILQMAVQCFRNCELKCQEIEINIEEQNNELNIPLDNDIIEKLSKNEELNFSEQIQYEKVVIQRQEQQKELKQILSSVQTYLAYSFCCLQEWNQVIIFASKALKSNLISNENQFNCNNYLFEALLETGNSKQAGIHLSNIFSKNLELKFDEQMKARNQVEGENSAFFLSNQDQKIKGKLSIIILNTNLILLNIKNNQIQQASQILNQLFKTLDLDILSTTTEIPVPLLNMLIYINLRLGNTKNALTLLKGRRLLTLNNNKALLEITK